MARYLIYEGNIEKLNKKLASIEKKCNKYNMNFKYERVGEEFHEVKDDNGDTITVKYIEVEVEGFLKHENWEFIATIDHYNEGNIIRQFNTEIEVPERYRHTEPICEHCNTNRRRKFTYLVHNTETDEWKQVGNTCLKEFTGGLDAEAAAYMEQWFKKLEEGQEGCFSGVRYTPMYHIEDFLCYGKEVVDKFGYVSTSDDEVMYGNKQSTREMTFEFYLAIEKDHPYLKHVRDKAEEIRFDAMSDGNKEYVKNAIQWIRSNEETDGYMFNLRLACSEDYIPTRNFGLVVSLLPTYYRHLKHLEYVEKQKKKASLESEGSNYQGEKGQRLSFEVASCELVYSNDGFYGMNYLYKFIDLKGNVYMWSTSKSLKTDDVKIVTGTVKNHEEFRGVKQTHLTRCKIA